MASVTLQLLILQLIKYFTAFYLVFQFVIVVSFHMPYYWSNISPPHFIPCSALWLLCHFIFLIVIVVSPCVAHLLPSFALEASHDDDQLKGGASKICLMLQCCRFAVDTVEIAGTVCSLCVWPFYPWHFEHHDLFWRLMLSQRWHCHPPLSTTALLLLEEEVVAVAVTLANEPIVHSCFISACMNTDPRCLARW